jgi:hypothetical protein
MASLVETTPERFLNSTSRYLETARKRGYHITYQGRGQSRVYTVDLDQDIQLLDMNYLIEYLFGFESRYPSTFICYLDLLSEDFERVIRLNDAQASCVLKGAITKYEIGQIRSELVSNNYLGLLHLAPVETIEQKSCRVLQFSEKFKVALQIYKTKTRTKKAYEFDESILSQMDIFTKLTIDYNKIPEASQFNAYERLPDAFYDVIMDQDGVLELIEQINDTKMAPNIFETWREVENHYSGKIRDGIELECEVMTDFIDEDFFFTYRIGPINS